MTVNFYFMRHGQTYLNKYERMQGWSNAPLTPEGEKGCIASGKGLADIQFDAIYTSDLKRTQDTAKLVLSQNHHTKDYQLIAKPEFREIFFGAFEGLPIMDVWPKVLKAAGTDLSGSEKVLNMMREMDPAHEAENYMMFWSRVEKGLLDLLNEHKNSERNILIVSHGLTIQLMLAAIIHDFEVGEPFHNASVSKIRYADGQFHLDRLNDISHFIWE